MSAVIWRLVATVAAIGVSNAAIGSLALDGSR